MVKIVRFTRNPNFRSRNCVARLFQNALARRGQISPLFPGAAYYHSLSVASPTMLVYCALLILGGLYRLWITSLSSSKCGTFYERCDPVSTIGVVSLVSRAHLGDLMNCDDLIRSMVVGKILKISGRRVLIFD